MNLNATYHEIYRQRLWQFGSKFISAKRIAESAHQRHHQKFTNRTFVGSVWKLNIGLCLLWIYEVNLDRQLELEGEIVQVGLINVQYKQEIIQRVATRALLLIWRLNYYPWIHSEQRSMISFFRRLDCG
jgi:hypothetical protein